MEDDTGSAVCTEEHTTTKDVVVDSLQHDGDVTDSNTVTNATPDLLNHKDDPYAYLDREFSSEKFKIEISGLPKYYGMKELKKLVNDKLMLSSNKLKPVKQYSPYIFICFRSEDGRQKALKALDGYKWKGKILSAKVANPAPDPLVKKRKEHGCDKDGNPVKKEKLDLKSQEERLKESTTPLCDVPYEEQLRQKEDNIKTILKKLGNDLLYGNPNLSSWIEQQKLRYDGLPCELWDIRKSPIVNGYRNKCEFTIGINEETGERTVGFRLSSYVRGFTGVGPIDCLSHVPQRMKDAVKIFEKYVRDSELDVFNPETHEGYWRQLTARLSSGTGELMLIVGMHPQQLTVEDIQKVKDDLVRFFQSGDGMACDVTSVYFEHIPKKKAGVELPPLEHICGKTHIYEKMCGLTFRVSPQAFFQINTLAAEELYDMVRQISSPSNDTTLVDVCCGTGSIGLSLSKHCGQVLGLELLPQAVDDAKANASLNNITNCTFFAGRAEEILPSVMSKSLQKDVIAVVDPPRAGLHQKALVALRRNENLKKMVFLSCDPKAAMKNFVDFGRPGSKMYKGQPLVPVRAVPVDMFPHTRHCELIVYFERLESVMSKSGTKELGIESESAMSLPHESGD